MPEDKGFFSGASDALKLAVPLVIQKRRLDSVENRFQQQMSMKRLEILEKGEDAHEKIQANFIKSKADNLYKALKTAMDNSDEAAAGNIMEELNKLEQGFILPDELEGKPQKLSLENLATQGMTSEQAVSLLTKKINKTGTKLGQPRFYQHKDDPSKIISIQENEMPPTGYLPYFKPSTSKDMTTERRTTAKDVAKYESNILKGEYTQADIDFVNRYAKKPYVYAMTSGEDPFQIWGLDIPWTDEDPEVKQIKLPKYNGKQIYASDIYENMMENDKTFEEVLRKIGAIK